MSTVISIPAPAQGLPVQIELAAGTSVVFVGSNGAGKTRLGIYIEQTTQPSHRIPAQRSLNMPDNVELSDYASSMRKFLYGHRNASPDATKGNRWGNRPAVMVLSDYDNLLSALFAQQNLAAVEFLRDTRDGVATDAPVTVLEKVTQLWARLLPERKLKVADATVRVSAPADLSEGLPNEQIYNGSELSDGERVIFYMIGNCLLASSNSVVIIDEPENHIHAAIINQLFDAIEQERRDCCFVYITHNVDFAVSRSGAAKYYVKRIVANSRWEIHPIPTDTGLPENVITELVGARTPIMFVEGHRDGLDNRLYRALFPNLNIQSIGPCDAVIHSVSSFRQNASLHRLGTVMGVVDSDHRSPEETSQLGGLGIGVLRVAELENVFLNSDVFIRLAKLEGKSESEAVTASAELQNKIFEMAVNDTDLVAARYTKRQVDRRLKAIDLNGKSLIEIEAAFSSAIGKVKPSEFIDHFKVQFVKAISDQDFDRLLYLYDNKGLLSVAARLLGLASKDELVGRAVRHLGKSTSEASQFRASILLLLPEFLASH